MKDSVHSTEPLQTQSQDFLLHDKTVTWEDNSGVLPFSIYFRMALLLVRFEIFNPGETPATWPTAVRFLPSVNSLVFPQVPSLWEHLPTCGAAERFLSCVDPLVDLQLLGPVKGFATVVTDEQSFLGSGSIAGFVLISEGLGQGETSTITSPAVESRRGWWKIGCSHWVRTRELLFFHWSCRRLVKKLNHRVSIFIIIQHVKLRVIFILLTVYHFLQQISVLYKGTEFTLKERRGATDLHSSAAAAVPHLAALALAGGGLSVWLVRAGSLSWSSTGNTFHHSFSVG